MNTTSTSTTGLRERGTAGMRVPADGEQREGQPNALPAPLPESRSQHMRALNGANQKRIARAGLKRELAGAADYMAARVRAAEMLGDTDLAGVLAGMKTDELLAACRRMGGATVRRVLASVGVPELKKIGDLTPRQVDALRCYLAGDAVPSVPLIAPRVRPVPVVAAMAIRPPVPDLGLILEHDDAHCPKCKTTTLGPKCGWCSTRTTRLAVAA